MEVYFADGPLRGKFMYVHTWPIRCAEPPELEAREFDLHTVGYEETALIEFSEVVYDSFYTIRDIDGQSLRIAYISHYLNPPTIKDLLMRD